MAIKFDINQMIRNVYKQKPEENSKSPSETPAEPIITIPVSINKSTLPFFDKLKKGSSEFFKNNTANFKYLLLAIPIIAIFFFTREAQKNQSLQTKASGVTISLSTNRSNPRRGDTFVVAVGMNTNSLKVSAADLNITYDPNLMDLVSSRMGTFLPVTLLPAKTAAGSFAVTVGCDPTSPVTGTGVLAELTFLAKANGQTTINFSSNTAVAVLGQDTNATGTMSPIQITIGYFRSPTPTPASTPTLTPTPTRTPWSWHTPTPSSVPLPTNSPTQSPVPTTTP